MKISILSLHITGIMCISHMIKHPWKMSCEGIHQFLIGGRVYNVLAPSTPGYNGLSSFWSSRMLWGKGVEWGCLGGRPFYPLLPSPDRHTRSYKSWGKPRRNTQSQRNSFSRACTREGGVRAGGWTAWLHLALSTHALHTHTPYRLALLAEARTFHVPLTSSFQAISSGTH